MAKNKLKREEHKPDGRRISKASHGQVESITNKEYW